jgi:hypothetical protein
MSSSKPRVAPRERSNLNTEKSVRLYTEKSLSSNFYFLTFTSNMNRQCVENGAADLPRARDDDGRAIPGGEYVRDEVFFEVDVATPRAPYPSDAIFDPAPELLRQQDAAFLASGRISASLPAPKPGRFHRRSLRRLP